MGDPASCAKIYLRNNNVVKFPGVASERVARVLLQHGAATTAEIAAELALSQQAVRRSLTSLEEVGLVQSHEQVPFGPRPLRGRGRPSLTFSLTEAGRGACEQGYDGLALESLRYIEREFGREAISGFARNRARRIMSGANTEEIVASLNSDGYAASVESTPAGEQLCQHHCPVVDAAREFPELCEAETQELSFRLGRHVTRLATLAQGDAICTTLIPKPNPQLSPELVNVPRKESLKTRTSKTHTKKTRTNKTRSRLNANASQPKEVIA